MNLTTTHRTLGVLNVLPWPDVLPIACTLTIALPTLFYTAFQINFTQQKVEIDVPLDVFARVTSTTNNFVEHLESFFDLRTFKHAWGWEQGER